MQSEYRIKVICSMTYVYNPLDLETHPAKDSFQTWDSANYRQRAVHAAEYDLKRDLKQNIKVMNKSGFNDPFTVEIVEYYPDELVGYIIKDGRVLCKQCVGPNTETNEMWDGVAPVKVYAVNLNPYSQDCHVCDKVFYKGTVPTILFDRDRKLLKHV